MKSPVVIFAYNRADHLKQTIDALGQNIGAKETEVYIFSDGPKNEKAKAGVEEVRKLINSEYVKALFSKLTVVESDKNKGLANSVISGVTNVINEYGKVIVVEDDLITSRGFLNYMNGALDFYEKNEKVGSISAYTGSFPIPKEYKHDVYMTYRGCSWGWATWKNRWDDVDWRVSDYDDLKKSIKKRIQFNRGGWNLQLALDDQMQGRIDSWAVRWCYSLAKRDLYTVYPIVARVKNIGFDGSGTHCVVKNEGYFDATLANEEKCIFENLEIDPKIAKGFKNFYMSFPLYVRRRIERIILKILGKR